MITKESIYQTYVRTICSNCKNRHLDLCHITIDMNGKARCRYYEKDKELEGYKEFKGRTAQQSKPIMKNINK